MAREVKVNSREMAEKWNRRLKGSGEDIRRGVERVTENPAQKAIEKQDKMLANLSESVRNGKWARGLGRISLQDWKGSMLDLGIGRIAAGADRAVPKVEAFASQLIDHENAGLARIDGMADVTLEDSINRMTTWMRHMSEFERH